jgi:hypothetical protein
LRWGFNAKDVKLLRGMGLGKLWKTTISLLIHPENPCGAMAPLAVAGVFQSLPKWNALGSDAKNLELLRGMALRKIP